MGRHVNEDSIYDYFGHHRRPGRNCKCGGHKHHCKCRKETDCECPVKLPMECIRYTGKETDILKKNKNLEHILIDLEKAEKEEEILIESPGIIITHTPLGKQISIDEEWLKAQIQKEIQINK